MKLRNKNTGEIVVFGEGIVDLNQIGCKNVAEMIEAGWEDYKEKEYFYLDMDGDIRHTTNQAMVMYSKELGNCFETEEEAEKAVKKLKAWKRLKDSYCEPIMWKWKQDYPNDACYIEVVYECHFDSGVHDTDLDLLFGGEE